MIYSHILRGKIDLENNLSKIASNSTYKKVSGTSLVVQWFRLCSSTARGMGLMISGHGCFTCHAMGPKKKERVLSLCSFFFCQSRKVKCDCQGSFIMVLSWYRDPEVVTCPSATICWILWAIIKVVRSRFVGDGQMTRIPAFQVTWNIYSNKYCVSIIFHYRFYFLYFIQCIISSKLKFSTSSPSSEAHICL